MSNLMQTIPSIICISLTLSRLPPERASPSSSCVQAALNLGPVRHYVDEAQELADTPLQ